MSRLLFLYKPRRYDFYVDATLGNNNNSGRSQNDPWQTIARVNAAELEPGDRVLFKCGETWAGTRLVVPASGLYGVPIVFSSYGAGANPVIDGNDAVNCVSPNGNHHLAFHNIEVTQGLDFGFEFNNVHDISLYDCEAHDCGNDNVLFINGTYGCYIRNLVSYDAYERAAGPRISCLEIADGAHDIVVETAELYGSVHAGFSIHSHPDTEFPYNLTLRNINSHDNDLFGGVMAQDNAAAALPTDANIRIYDSVFVDNATGAGTGGQIWLSNTGDPYPDGIVFEDCIAYSTLAGSDRPLYIGGLAGPTFIHCLFRANYQTLLEGADGATFYNCTFYREASDVFQVAVGSDNLTIKNCIIYSTGNVPINIRGTPTADIDYNLYRSAVDVEANAVMIWNSTAYNWANWKTQSGGDANSPTPADPTFTNPAADDFTLQLGSPAIDAGVVIPGVTDGYLGAAPDCGYAERA